jgi:hypothetical protein
MMHAIGTQGETMAELARNYDVGEANIYRAIDGR